MPAHNKGITLIALILTIIVLLILTVVAISAVTGNGIIAHAKNSKKNYTIAQEEEELNIDILDWKTANSNNEKQTLQDFLKEKYGEGNVKLNADKSITITLESGKQYKISEDGKISLIDATETEEKEMIKFSLTNLSNETTEYSVENGMTWQEAFDAGYFFNEESTNFWYEMYGTEEKQKKLSSDENIYYYAANAYTNGYIVTDAKECNILIANNRLYFGGCIYYDKDGMIYDILRNISWYYIIPEGADKSSSSQVKPSDKITQNGKYVVYNDD